jgi:alpha 1,3-glucosidase
MDVFDIPWQRASLIKDAIRDRQLFLPYWYTVFHEHTTTGLPVIRPIVMHAPLDENAFDIDYEYFIGEEIADIL